MSSKLMARLAFLSMHGDFMRIHKLVLYIKQGSLPIQAGSQCTILTDNYCEDAYDLLQTPMLKKILVKYFNYIVNQFHSCS